MPQFGETVEEEIDIGEWMVKVGDRIEIGDVIAIAETGKTSLEIESPEEGILKEILVEEGESTLPLHVIARVE